MQVNSGNPPTMLQSKTRITQMQEYIIWAGMIARCYDKANPKYPEFGGQGIGVCRRWRTSFDNFFKDMGKRPHGTYWLMLRRKRNYSKSNCYWISPGDYITKVKAKKRAALQAQEDIHA